MSDQMVYLCYKEYFGEKASFLVKVLDSEKAARAWEEDDPVCNAYQVWEVETH